MENNDNNKLVTFQYEPLSIAGSKPYNPADKQWQGYARIETLSDSVKVTVIQPDNQAVNNIIEKRFDQIAAMLYRKHLKKTPWGAIQWFFHNVRDYDGREVVYRVTFDSPRMGSTNFDLVKFVGDYMLRGIEFTGSELVLDLGFFSKTRKVVKPLSHFPSLAKASEDDRSCRTHKYGSVLYFPRLKEKLVLRDVELFDASTVKQPEGMPEPQFLYETASPFIG